MRLLFAVVAMTLAATAHARDLPVPLDKGWQHAKTGLILMPTLAGEQRTALTDSGQDELDVAAQYGTGAGDVSITVYLFHPGLDDVALWFDRIDTAIHARDIYGGVTATTTSPTIFRRPNSSTDDSLRMVYAPQKGPYRSTAAAIMPLGDWLVSIRISSKVDVPAALSAELDTVIAGIRFPASAAASRPVTPISACTTHIAYHHARLIKPDSSQVLLGALAGTLIADKSVTTDAKPVTFCRDGAGTTEFGVYRQDNDTPEYWLAFNDAGQAAYVSGGLTGLIGKGGFQVQLLTFDGTDVFQNFDQLPEPKQAAALVETGTRLSHTSGKNISLDSSLGGK
jgi:hypothetical protein